ncbi:MAG: hypothetical protein P8X42_16110 [Calditrichaceae bacterium]|jgi:uncharacterized protein HemX
MKWIIIFAVLAGIAALLYFGMDWQVVTMIGAAVAAPFKFVAGLFGKRSDQIRKEHQNIRQQEAEFQEKLESGIREKEEQIRLLDKEMSGLDNKIRELQEKKRAVDKKYQHMDLEELSEVGANYFGS